MSDILSITPSPIAFKSDRHSTPTCGRVPRQVASTSPSSAKVLAKARARATLYRQRYIEARRMTNYDFRSLSPNDFERLSHDLLEVELGGRFERFTSGPDSGIDARRLLERGSIILQCKHYSGSPFAKLLADMRRERKHVRELQPGARYILATSMGLTPKNKDRLFEILQPRCVSPGDIFGRDDINDLLAKHPKIEERHHKLWLTSTATLERVIRAFFTDHMSDLDDVRRRLSRYVPNPSHSRAKKILDEHHICIISGIPGIGKTTLAEVLVTDLVDREGFVPFRISNRLDEIRSAKDRSKQQVFYFDDFLGRTDLVRLERNEDRELLDLMREVKQNDHWRLVLTTREYILNAAKRHYEAIDQLPDGFARCIIDLSDYTLPIRAQILYNHIYFSDLSKSHRLALTEKAVYRQIIDHKNFMPRMIDFMTGKLHVRDDDARRYVRDFLRSLDDPKLIWSNAFQHQIQQASQCLILVLATLPRRVYEEDARTCFVEFRKYRKTKYGETVHPNEWDTALRELDGSFVSTIRVGGQMTLQFHNPSVEDFIREHMERTRVDFADLLESAVFFEQYARLWGRHGERLKLLDSAFGELATFIPGLSARTVWTNGRFVVTVGEDQVRFLIGMAKRTGRDVLEAAKGAMAHLARLWQSGDGDKAACLRLLLDWRKQVGGVQEALLNAAKSLLLDSGEYLDDFETGAQFVEAFPNAASEEELELFADSFDADLWDVDDEQSLDDLMQVVEVMELVGRVLGVDVDYVVDSLNERIGELEMKEKEEMDYNRPRSFEHWKERTDEEGTIDAMFAGLRDFLVDS